MLPNKLGVDSLRGTALITALTSVCSTGFWLFGYDQGVMSGVVISTYWLETMGNPSTIMLSTITALYDVGAIFGAIFASFTSEPMGRKRTLIFGAFVLLVGTILMGTCVERIQMMVARVVTGIGIGYITSVTPVYQSEITLPEHRGWQLCCQLTSMLGGLVLAYWLNYGWYFHSGAAQWRFPLLFQLVFCVYIIVITVWLPETPRWLIRHDATPERGIKVLAKLRNLPEDHEIVVKEAKEIIDAIELECKEEGSWLDLFKDNGVMGRNRFYLALGIQFMQEMTGINIITYYAPTLFKESLKMTQEQSLFLGCWVQVWYLIASFVTWYTIDRVGRRKLWLSMAVMQMLVLVLEAICVAINNPSSSIAAVFFIFLYESCFTWGWMATVWVYPAEILPLKIRGKGAALGAAANFLGNFLVVEITPPALQNIGWRTYIIFAVFNVVIACIVWACYPETSGQSLEAIDELFRYHDRAAKDASIVARIQWSIVPKADEAVRRVRAQRRTARTEEGQLAKAMESAADRSESASLEKKTGEAQVESIPAGQIAQLQ
ncbi:general substrate transporter [Wolfiporia cocos MD-104 SS10]|uniref:General substrate transporter n=1 Tax=Wolfiporia cocos (strain MD-104) TaxID=742152 RepID=A0A2H3JGQ3_WOLCO|nr:general substrate transporter [Wolfiporia cocos MD-104 SS10]